MKRFYSYIGVRNTGKRRVAAVACLVFIAIAMSVNVLAAEGSWFRKSYVVVNYYGDTDSYFLMNTGEQDGQCTHGTSAFVHDFGYVDKLYLKKFIGSGWYADNHDISSMHGWYRVYRQGDAAPSWTMIDMNNYDNGCEHKINHIKSWYSNNDINLLNNLDPGMYYFETAMSMWETYSGGQFERMIPGNGQYNPATSGYNSTFAIRGFMADDVDFRRVSRDQEHSQAYEFYAYGWSSNKCTVTISGTNASDFSFVSGNYEDASRTKTEIEISSDKSSTPITIYFKAPNEGGVDKTAKLTITGTPDGTSTELTKTITITASTTNDNVVLYLADSVKTLSGPYAQFSAYVRSTGCNVIAQHGFVWGTSSGSYNKTTINLGGLSKDAAGTTFTGKNASSSELTVGNTYYYKAFATTSNDASNPKKNETFYSPEGQFTLYYECDYPDPVNDVLDVYINNTSGYKDKCLLHFESIKDALTTIRGIGKYYSGNSESGKLLCNVKFHIANTGTIYQEADVVGNITGGSVADGDAPTTAKCIMIEKFNNNNPDKRLVLTGESKTDRPTLLHPVIRNSKNIDCKYLVITGSKDGYTKSSVTKHDNAIDIDNGSKDWTGQTVGAVSNADITFTGCEIKSYGFTCMHISAYDGIYVEDCDLDAEYSDGEDDNSTVYGSSIKLIHCKNVKLLRNNFRGSHATSTWLQGCNNVLLMNNVYWNNNTFENNVAFIRLVCQISSEYVKNVGMYYNTLYLADASNFSKVDFLRLGTKYSSGGKGPIEGNEGNYEASSIEFKFNNCYSYDEDVDGKTADDNAFLKSGKLAEFCGKIDFNNFWSQYDEKAGHDVSNFEIKPCLSTTSRFIDVSKAVCETAASDPSSLVLKTDALNMGTSVKTDVSGLGAEQISADRLHDDEVRPLTKSSGGGNSKAGSEGAAGTITLTVNDNITTASKDIDISALGLTASSTVTCTLSGEGSSKFSKSHNSFTVDGYGKLSTKVFTITFNKPASAGTYEETLTFSTIAGDGPRSMTINLKGIYSTTTPIEGGWTLGAYQMSHGEKVHTIIWNGGTEDDETSWDNRNNWRKLDGSYVTCVDLLSEDLRVIIPAPEKIEGENDGKGYPRPDGGITNYPVMPEDFNTLRKKDAEGETKYGEDIVNAGQNIDGAIVTKYASSIDIQSGGAIKGVEYLYKDHIRRYDEASTTYMLPRSKWLLVGTVIKPFTDGKKSHVRNLTSGDFYMDMMPQVYMHESKVNAGSPEWNNSFSELDKEVAPDKVFAVYLPDQYGKFKVTAATYSRVYKTLDAGDGSVTKSRYFNGWFQNESSPLTFSGLDSDNGSFCSNTYPANLDVYKLKQGSGNSGASIQLYNSSLWTFQAANPSAAGQKEILSQSGFFVTGVTSLTITPSMFNDTETMYRQAGASLPYCSLLLRNPSNGRGCIADLRYDELKTDSYISGTDAPKLFISTSGYESVPDLYILRYGMKLSMLHIPTLDEAVPLGVAIKQKMKVEFSLSESENFEKAELTDTETGIKTDLLKDSYSVELEKGEYNDRFYLNLKVEDNVPTVVKENKTGADGEEDISIIYANGRASISSTDGVVLQEAYISDMAGRTTHVKLRNAHYNDVKIKGADGVYIIKVVGDVMNKTEKVIVK